MSPGHWRGGSGRLLECAAFVHQETPLHGNPKKMYVLNLEIQSMGVRLRQGEALFRVICACETEMLLLLACIFAQSFPLSTPSELVPHSPPRSQGVLTLRTWKSTNFAMRGRARGLCVRYELQIKTQTESHYNYWHCTVHFVLHLCQRQSSY